MTEREMNADELLVRLGWRLRETPAPDDWERGFILSILGAAKRQRQRWRPTPKQLAAMRKIATRPRLDPAGHGDPHGGDEVVLIEND